MHFSCISFDLILTCLCIYIVFVSRFKKDEDSLSSSIADADDGIRKLQSEVYKFFWS